MTYELLVRGGKVLLPGRDPLACDVAISGQHIAAVLAPGERADAEEVIDASGLHVLPGIVDPHVHFGLGHPDDWETESRAAAQGGITTVRNYIQSTRSYTLEEPEERARAAAQSVIDWVTSPIIMNEEHLSELPRYIAEHGIETFKYFANFKGREGAYMGVEGTDTGFFFALCRAVAADPRALIAVHPENIETIWRLTAEVISTGREELAAYSDARPDFAEAHDIFTALLFARVTGCRMYLPHVTSRLALDVIARQRGDGSTIYVETCPHYLTHTALSPIGSLAKVNPPLRADDDCEALWSAIADGSIVAVGSDHNSRPRAKKQGPVWTASAGFPGVNTLLPVMVSEGHHRRGIPLRRIVEVLSGNPAQILGLAPRKGAIAPGADADLVLVDLDREATVDSADSDSRSDFSIYDGWKMRGWPVLTIRRGSIIVRDGEVIAAPGTGRAVSGRPAVGSTA